MDELTDEQWALVEPMLPRMNIHRQAGVLRRAQESPTQAVPEPVEGYGWPAKDARKVLNGILFYIRNALTWANIPPDYPSYVTLFRRYHEWKESGVLQEVIYALTRHMCDCSGLRYEEALRSHKLSYRMKDGSLIIYLPEEYSTYWMQPTATLLLMWMVTASINVYGEMYRRDCKQKGVDRLPGRAGPRKVRPVSVEVVVGKAPSIPPNTHRYLGGRRSQGGR